MNNTEDCCPICLMDLRVENKKNSNNMVTTECGHTFHTNCLMSSVAHGGFKCPCCRAVMVDVPEEDETEVATDSEWEWSSDIEISDNYSLQSMRWMYQREAGEELEAEDPEDAEEEYQIPSVDYITVALTNQGVTMNDLVKCILMEHEEYEDDQDIDEMNDILFGKIRMIVSNYPNVVEMAPVPVPVPTPEPTPIVQFKQSGCQLNNKQEAFEEEIREEINQSLMLAEPKE